MEELLKIARKAIKDYMEGKTIDEIEAGLEKDVKEKFSERKACFVTLTLNGNLRGCIGSLTPSRELYRDVIENSIHASFHDFRFYPLTKEELPKIKIEISILSDLKKLEFRDENELLKKINKDMGIVLKKREASATFLPQVWEQIPDKREFLEQLSLKAGLNRDAWKDAEIYFYKVEKIKE